jgi:nucleotide-binding universal stress UspA family protein
MPFKDILFHAFEGEAGPAVRAAALGLAQKHSAQATGLGIVDDTPIPSYVLPYGPGNFQQSYLKDARAKTKSLRAEVEEAGRKSGVHVEWRYAEGDILAIINLHSHYTDLVVLGHGVPADAPIGAIPNLANHLILSIAKPILLVPWRGDFSSIGQNVLVAWSSTAESSRAVHDALPILTQAEEVHILTVGSGAEDHIPGAEISAHLARHGVKVVVDHAINGDHSTGETILNKAVDMNADMIVSGAWGHSRLQEMVMGGVTRHLLRNLHLPVLMSH